MVAPLIGRAAAIAAAKLLAKKGAKKAIKGGQVANKLPTYSLSKASNRESHFYPLTGVNQIVWTR